MNQQPQQIQIKADDATANGVYANMMQIAHTKEEFALDFMNIMPPQGALVSRIFTSPGHAKRILKALEENIKNYEKQFGNIEEAEEPKGGIGFQG
ncbi:DUF3467 domain-containing protein [bacterium (Candidatus Howlettbacteria) CG_4_10_14_0_8_um_filter_40_9]|nr:MAG: DUF3467 domain-containing protein [bacterium (Candidatus Howlettbacteria) CG_4_10_14_0_8_um_filter_40_9]